MKEFVHQTLNLQTLIRYAKNKNSNEKNAKRKYEKKRGKSIKTDEKIE